MAVGSLGVWQGVAVDSLKFHLGLPCPTFLRPAAGPSLKRPYSRAGDLLPSSTPLDTPRRASMVGSRAAAQWEEICWFGD
jgi:hypothetical protein